MSELSDEVGIENENKDEYCVAVDGVDDDENRENTVTVTADNEQTQNGSGTWNSGFDHDDRDSSLETSVHEKNLAMDENEGKCHIVADAVVQAGHLPGIWQLQPDRNSVIDQSIAEEAPIDGGQRRSVVGGQRRSIVGGQRRSTAGGKRRSTARRSTAMKPVHKKIVIVGDGVCGKTCLLITYVLGAMPTEYVPTVFESYTYDTEIDGQTYSLSLCDTAGQEAYDRLRTLSYDSVDVIIVCFSVDMPDSLNNVIDKWVPEVRHFCPGVPMLFACMKVDLRNDDQLEQRLTKLHQAPLSPESCLDASVRMGADVYVECSSLTNQNIRELFTAAVRLTLRSKFRDNFPTINKLKRWKPWRLCCGSS